jgi:hypothetical protein
MGAWALEVLVQAMWTQMYISIFIYNFWVAL